MNDRLYPVSIQHLISWMLSELKSDQLFGIQKDLFFTPDESDPFRMQRYGQMLETPIGVAAGPHTQLSQNIIAAWLCGARYMELKTVQTLDELEVSKPCIDMQDEGYNCEWSQELKLKQSLDEYLNAWIAIHVLKDHFGWQSDQGAGVIFNMSVGYDLDGIMKPNVQQFMDRMENSQELLNGKLDLIESIYPNIKNLNIPSRMTDNITLSTMHGCPPDEIERIATYLIKERNYHTAVKLNPTLLGPEQLRQILNHDLGYEASIVPDEAFDHDLKYPDALNLIGNLQAHADEAGVEFGLKLTNTLEVQNHRPVFPENESMMYLSGRALHPISINLAAKLQKDFHGKLDLSFSAGADAFNVADILACNLRPVTTCTDVLKPGGYTRLGQYLDNLKQAMQIVEARSLDQLILGSDDSQDIDRAGLNKLLEYAEQVIHNSHYHKHSHHFDSIKTKRHLGAFDCISAPCVDACAADQNIPEYLYHTSQGDFTKAFEAIQDTNPLPGVTGAVCDHLCQLKCTRNNYDSPLLIREIKRFVTEQEIGKAKSSDIVGRNHRVAVIGAGPAGLSCAYFLAKQGVSVEVYESKSYVGGMVSGAIPEFRLSDKTINLDIDVLKNMGVNFHFDSPVGPELYKQIQELSHDVFIGVGAQRALKLGVEGETLSGILNPLEFLAEVRLGARPDLGQNIAIIGGGNTAMDAARTSLRLAGESATVSVIYRRTMSEMPADIDEIEAALAEGITFHELIAPLSFEGNGRVKQIHCQKMELGEPDASGRRRPVPLDGEFLKFPVDTVIPSIGQAISVDFIGEDDLQVDYESCKTTLPHVYAGGDAVRGASSVINAIGDGQNAARHILQNIEIPTMPIRNAPRVISVDDLKVKAGSREYGMNPPLAEPDDSQEFPEVHRTLTQEEAITEASRCLLCDDYCSVCVGVCPNLANLTYIVKPVKYEVHEIEKVDDERITKTTGHLEINQEPQVLNIGDFCNECGNCTTFCPTAGDPYLDKPRLHLTDESFRESNTGYLISNNSIQVKIDNYEASLVHQEGEYLFSSPLAQLSFDGESKILKFSKLESGKVSTLEALEMIVLYENLKDHPMLVRHEFHE
ncbi:MAG: putative selenate reductase subunit YgfK [FCB group bacterium]|nr:putative selenate reductase subunit YgfK [FCB group bacterium]MBL7027171.1 putative selenate reductase subunit YgfK [Candidatus Neomarinimicrobiota bacterium]MBL7120594.1 putative selenate reductase subunit YgfK [Candidatus Neomarinimicrobiota bacterium]